MLLKSQNISLSDVMDELATRQSKSGLVEKNLVLTQTTVIMIERVSVLSVLNEIQAFAKEFLKFNDFLIYRMEYLRKITRLFHFLLMLLA